MDEEFLNQLRELGLRAEDFEETFARSAGPGGQNVNKVNTSVTLRHVPTGIQVTVQDSRSQVTNRKLARERILETIAAQRAAVRLEKQHAREKKRRQNRPKPRGLKEKILKTKKQRSAVKKSRARVME
ncbi:MAG TPA: peptide chain release factor-like protein [Chthoniobacterales bacterium]